MSAVKRVEMQFNPLAEPPEFLGDCLSRAVALDDEHRPGPAADVRAACQDVLLCALDVDLDEVGSVGVPRVERDRSDGNRRLYRRGRLISGSDGVIVE